jgi:thymidylate kinase
MRQPARNGRTSIVSFSGIDGAGKSTQIERFCARIEQAGRRYSIVRFWDDVARLTWLRESAAHWIFRGDKGAGKPSNPIKRRDKNVQSWFMSGVRLFLYLADAAATRLAMEHALASGVDVVIFDRFIYDELANLKLKNPLVRAYVRMILEFVPRPDFSFVLDSDPAQALARKPEYPLEFLKLNRSAYFSLSALVGGIIIITPMSIGDVESEVLQYASRILHYQPEIYSALMTS